MSYFTNKGWTKDSVFEVIGNDDCNEFPLGSKVILDKDDNTEQPLFKYLDGTQVKSGWVHFENLKYIGEIADQCENFYDCDSKEACIGECKFKDKDVNTQNNSTEYEVGDLVEVIDKQHGHKFKIGDVVVIEDIDDNSFGCSNLGKSEYWWLDEDEIKPYKKVIDVAESDQPKLRTAEDYRKLAPTTEIEVVVDGHKTMIPLFELLMISRLSGNVINRERPSTLFYFFDDLFSVDGVDPLCDLEVNCDTEFTNLDSFLDKFFIGNKKLELERDMQEKLDQIENLRNEVHKLDAELSKYS